MSPDEVLRWLYRHGATLHFERDEQGGTRVVLATPLRHPEGQVDRVAASVTCSHDVVDVFVGGLVDTVRERICLE